MIWKRYWPYIGYVDEAKTHSLKDLSKCFRRLFAQQKFKYLCFLSSSRFGIINFDPQRRKFPMVFHIFVNIFSRAEGCMWMPFEFGFFNKLCLLFNLESQKTNLKCSKKIYIYLFKHTFSPEKCNFQQYHCGAVAFTINLEFLLKARL